MRTLRLPYVLTCLAVALLFSFSAQARKVKTQVQFDKQTDFAAFKTYAWMKHDAVARPFLALAIIGDTDYELQARGLTNIELDAKPDLLVTSYGGIDTGMNLPANDPTYSGMGGVPPLDSSMWTSGSFSGSKETAVYVQKGTLVIDIVDARASKLVWRGVAIGNMDDKPSKVLEGLGKAIERLFQKYPGKREPGASNVK